MKFDVNRLSKLAGLESDETTTVLSEGSNRSRHEDPALADDKEHYHGKQLNEMELADDEDEVSEADDMDEVYEIDEADLVAELRRVKMMAESRRRQEKEQALQEAQLKSIIDKEVKNILEEMEDLNITGNWVYGKNKPRNSRRGYVATSFPGIGFK
jgi:hypothetical protein